MFDTRGFVLRWTLANMVGLALGFAIWGIVHDTWGEQSDNQNLLVSLMGELFVGALAGTLQWLVLRPHISGMRWGIIGGSVGCAVGLIFGYFMGGIPFDFVLGFTGFGLGSGWGHWLGLRQYLVSQRWIVASSVGFGIAGIMAIIMAIAFGDAIDAAFGSGTTGFAAVLTMLGSVGGAVGGIITGTYLVRQPASQAEMVAPAN